ncbi:vacuolar amino acid efflux transporter Avt8 [Pelomyxa schiedti]|nr:vacuolar amino acid efflux transporter Avt8 [Pelomyxa schiedti]
MAKLWVSRGWAAPPSGESTVKNASVIGSTLNVIKFTIGAGILAIPFSFSVLGVAFSLLALVFLGVTLLMSCYFISASCEIIQARKEREGRLGYQVSFSDLSKEIVSWGYIFVDISFVLICFGACSSYLRIIGKLIPQIFSIVYSLSITYIVPSSFVCISVAFVGLLSVCFLKRLASLTFLSAVGSFGVVTMSILVISVYFIVGPQSESSIIWFAPLQKKTLQVLPVFVFAYCSHVNACTIFNELGKPKSVLRADLTFTYAQIFVFIIYSVVGLFGYLTFGSLISPNILQNYSSGIVGLVAQTSAVFILSSSYPLLLYPCRSSFISLGNLFLKRNPLWNQHKDYIAPVILVTATYTAAISNVHLDTVFAYCGATAGTLATLIVPSLCYFLLLGREGQYYNHEQAAVTILRGLSLVFAVLGGAIMVLCFFSTGVVGVWK